jgi:hypothetical protein
MSERAADYLSARIPLFKLKVPSLLVWLFPKASEHTFLLKLFLKA